MATDEEFVIEARLDQYVQRLRNRRGLTQKEAAAKCNTGLTTFRKIEQGETSGYGDSVLSAIAEVLCDTEDERSHLWALAGRPEFSAAQRAISAVGSISKIMRQFDAYPIAYMDFEWTIREANQRYDEAYPGIVTAPSMPEWLMFDPRARLVCPDWWREVESLVAVTRHLLTDPVLGEGVRALLEKLKPSPTFRMVWESGLVYAQRPSPYRRVWVPSTETMIIFEEFLLPVAMGGVLVLNIPVDGDDADALADLDWGLRNYSVPRAGR